MVQRQADQLQGAGVYRVQGHAPEIKGRKVFTERNASAGTQNSLTACRHNEIYVKKLT